MVVVSVVSVVIVSVVVVVVIVKVKVKVNPIKFGTKVHVAVSEVLYGPFNVEPVPLVLFCCFKDESLQGIRIRKKVPLSEPFQTLSGFACEGLGACKDFVRVAAIVVERETTSSCAAIARVVVVVAVVVVIEEVVDHANAKQKWPKVIWYLGSFII